MKYSLDDHKLVHELYAQGTSQRQIEVYTGIPRQEVRRILGLDKGWKASPPSKKLSTRQIQRLLNWRNVHAQ